MVYHRTNCDEVCSYIKYNVTDGVQNVMGVTGVSRAQIYRLRKEPLGVKSKSACRKGVFGRPRKLSTCDVRRILREVCHLRGTFPNWTAKQLMSETNMTHVSVRTVRRVLNNSGYRYLQTIKKGLLTAKDRKKRYIQTTKGNNETNPYRTQLNTQDT